MCGPYGEGNIQGRSGVAGGFWGAGRAMMSPPALPFTAAALIPEVTQHASPFP